MSKNITEKNKFEGGKTRIQSLKDRIDIAFETLRNLYDESKLEKINPVILDHNTYSIQC